MSKTFHICQSIEGALANWRPADWKCLAEQNQTSVREVKKHFRDLLAEGKKVMPFGKPCEGFSYQTGCPGHKEEQ